MSLRSTLIFFVSMSIAPQAWACSCGWASDEQYLSWADSVVIAKVIGDGRALKTPLPLGTDLSAVLRLMRTTRVKVIETIKSSSALVVNKDMEAELVADDFISSCDMPLTLGRHYIFFLTRSPAGTLRRPSQCGGSRYITLEDPDTKALSGRLKKLVDARAKTTELERITALINIVNSGEASLEDLSSAILDLQEPASIEPLLKFSLLLPVSSQPGMEGYLSTVGRLRDSRFVPLFVKGLSDVRPMVALESFRILTGLHGRDPEVIKAIVEMRSSSPDIIRARQGYLSEIGHPAGTSSKVVQTIASPAQGEQTLKQFEVALRQRPDIYLVTRNRALLAAAPASQRRDLWPMIWPVLKAAHMQTDKVYQHDLVEILRLFNMPETQSVLIEQLLSSLQATMNSFLLVEASRNATFAIMDLGTQARVKATEAVFNFLESTAPDPGFHGEAVPFLQLAFLSTSPSQERLDQIILKRPKLKLSLEVVNPLLNIGQTRITAADLRDRLESYKTNFAGQGVNQGIATVVEWLLYHLGDFKDPASVPLLLWYYQHSFHREVKQVVERALQSIDSEAVLQGLKAFLPNDSPMSPVRSDYHWQQLRADTLNLIVKINPKVGLEVIRQILKAPDSGPIKTALQLVGQFGTSDDLTLLEPFTDFWRNDRQKQMLAMRSYIDLRFKTLDSSGEVH